MRAAVCTRWGAPDSVELRELEDPTPGPGEVRLRVAATSLNGADAEMLHARFLYSRMGRPRSRVLGSDIAGTVDALGDEVEGFAVGDEVIAEVFERFGGLAELACVPANRLVKKPAALSFELACALPQAGVLALQGVEAAALAAGSEVLLVGGGGGVGVFALQLAKARGAAVTVVDHGDKLEALTAMGADRVVDYRTTDPLDDDGRYDLILDIAGAGSVRAYRRALTPTGVYRVVGGPVRHLLATLLFGGPAMKLLAWDQSLAHIEEMARRATDPGFPGVIGARFPLDEAAAAFAAMQRVVGKVVVTLESPAP